MAKVSAEFTLKVGTMTRLKFPRKKRADKLVNYLRKFVRRKMRLPDDVRIRIHPELNEQIWERGAENPPRKIKIRVEYDEEEKVATVFPAH